MKAEQKVRTEQSKNYSAKEQHARAKEAVKQHTAKIELLKAMRAKLQNSDNSDSDIK
jgi:N-dimethylarginine dimethylaminohydrolase